jgi:hypothetical protein
MGSATGWLGWRSDNPNVVDVTATIVDRPLPDEPDRRCLDDGRYTKVNFTGYANGGPSAATDSTMVDDGQMAASLRLVATAPIDTVVVQVCRIATVSGQRDYCGSPQRYIAPGATTR